MSVGEIKDFLQVDSLSYLELDRVIASTGAAEDSFCTACLSGHYVVPVPDLADAKLVLEKSTMPAPGDDGMLPVAHPRRA
jgi:amidophosphoribosyltransferase